MKRVVECLVAGSEQLVDCLFTSVEASHVAGLSRDPGDPTDLVLALGPPPGQSLFPPPLASPTSPSDDSSEVVPPITMSGTTASSSSNREGEGEGLAVTVRVRHSPRLRPGTTRTITATATALKDGRVVRGIFGGGGGGEATRARGARGEGGGEAGTSGVPGADEPAADAVVVVAVISGEGGSEVSEHLPALLFAAGDSCGRLVVVDVSSAMPSGFGGRKEPFRGAFKLDAYKLIKWKPNSRKCVQGLISTVLEIGGILGYDFPPCKTQKKPVIPQSAAATSSTIEKRKDAIWSLIPPGTALDITGMKPLTVRSFLQFLNLEYGQNRYDDANDDDEDAPATLEAVALRKWVQVKNWPAVTEVILSQSLRDRDVDLSKLGLDSVPNYLAGISCRTLNLSNNNIKALPQWLFYAHIQSVLLNPTDTLKGKRWDVARYNCLCRDEPTYFRTSKLILVGEDNSLKATFLRRLAKNSNKAIGEKHTVNPPVVSIQEFKLKKSNNTWIAWNLSVYLLTHLSQTTLIPLFFSGGPEHPFYPCFYCSGKSVFMYCFRSDSLGESSGPLKQVHFWLNEISRCQSQADVKVNAQVILIGFSAEGRFLHDSRSIGDEVINPIIHPLLEKKNFTFCGFAVLSLERAEGIVSSPFCHPEAIITRQPISAIAGLLKRVMNTTINTAPPVSPRWIAFSKRLSLVKASVIKWTDFVKLAMDCGVGTLHRGGRDPEIDLQMCCGFLSDIGAIIHFRHPFWTSRTPKEPLLASQANIIQALMPTPANTEKSHNHSHKMADLAESLYDQVDCGLDFPLGCRIHLSFFLLPSSNNDPLHSWETEQARSTATPSSSGKSRVTLTGRSVVFEGLHEGFLPQLMNMVRKLPGVEAEVFWRSGLWVFRKSNTGGITQQHDLMVASPSMSTSRALNCTSVDIFVRTTFERVGNPEGSSPSFNNLGALTIMWINRFRQDNNITTTSQSFPCPHCLKKKLQNWHDSHFHFFQESEVMKAALSGKISLECPIGIHTQVNLVDICPDLSCFMIDPSTWSATLAHRQGKGNGEPKRTVDTIYLLEVGHEVTATATRVIPVISVLREIPRDSNVVDFIGARLRSDNGKEQLVAATEAFPPLSVPPRLQESLGSLVAIGCGSAVNLRDLLKYCLERGKDPQTITRSAQSPTSILDQVLPMTLRGKILRDVAQGLCHLHSCNPPLVHDGLFLENGHIWITSLQDSGPGPWAKFAHLGSPSLLQNQTSRAGNNRNNKNKSGRFSPSFPEPPECDQKTDVWSFGVLVHQLVDPLNPFVEVELTARHPAGTFHPTSSTTTPTSTKQSPAQRAWPPPFAAPPTTAPPPPTPTTTTTTTNATMSMVVELSQLQRATAASSTSRWFTPTFTSSSPSSAQIPRWARQLMECCWAVEPNSRPDMCDLIRIWDHFLMEEDSRTRQMTLREEHSDS
ncbi:hypothetical protein Pelo_17697 [Pelomyxa schiedti]|nr:hypothetical protein Pelo_17697 [Pelomyxa schiedti]